MARSKNNLKAVLNDIADAIKAKKGIFTPVCPRDFADEINSLPAYLQPTLFAPIIIVNNNTVTWTNNSQNGGFSVSLIGRIDGNMVMSPFTITSEYDNKILEVTAYCLNFQNSVASVTLHYVN